MTTKIIDTIGTLELTDTGRRCTRLSEDVPMLIVRVRCSKCGETQDLDANLAAFFWASKRRDGGFHLGCLSPEEQARWKTEHPSPPGMTFDVAPAGACPCCQRLDCGGASA